MHYIGIDIGATKVLLALIKNKKAIKIQKIATPKNKALFLKMLKESVKEIKAGFKIQGIGIAVAGILNQKKDRVLVSPNLKFLKNIPLAKILQKTFKIPIKMENDANCFTLSEAILGAGKNYKTALGITLGSGVGSGFITKKQKTNNGAIIECLKNPEAGHHIIRFDGEKCSCSNIGCWEAYASQKFFQRKNTNSIETCKKADRGDEKSREILQEYGKYVGIGLANLVNILEPEVIILGGGLSNGWRYFLASAKKEMEKRIISPLFQKKAKIKIAQLGECSCALGAGLLFSF